LVHFKNYFGKHGIRDTLYVHKLITNKGTQLIEKKLSWKTFTPRSIGSLLIKSINGGLPRGVPVVSKSPSIGAPNTLVASQRLVTSKERK